MMLLLWPTNPYNDDIIPSAISASQFQRCKILCNDIIHTEYYHTRPPQNRPYNDIIPTEYRCFYFYKLSTIKLCLIAIFRIPNVKFTISNKIPCTNIIKSEHWSYSSEFRTSYYASQSSFLLQRVLWFEQKCENWRVHIIS